LAFQAHPQTTRLFEEGVCAFPSFRTLVHPSIDFLFDALPPSFRPS
jgi:hypothetical protein